MTDHDRRGRYYAALHGAGVDAVMRVADSENAELRAQLATIRSLAEHQPSVASETLLYVLGVPA